MKLRVGIDVGGTFTDVTAFDEDQGELVAVRKYVSNPAQPAAVMETITADLARDFGADAVTLILHGSTAALNTLLEGKGVRTGLLTTRGFRDVYEIGRQWRGEDVFNIFAPAPKMLLPRDRIFEIGERIGSQGEVIEPLLAEDVAGAVAQARGRRCRSGRGVLSVRLRQPRPRAGGGRDHSHDRARPLRIAVARGQSGMARIRAHGLDRGQRLYRSAGLALPADAGRAVAPALSALPRADDEIRRRRGERPHAGAHADPDRDVGAGGRRHRRPPSRRRQGHRQSHHLRHRRDQLRHGGAAGPAAVQVGGDGGAASAAHAHRRHRNHRRRRRQHRVGATGPRSQGRSAERGRPSRPGVLRPRRRRADADRRARRCSAISIPRRCSPARCRSRARKRTRR